ncbi:hypothetical protein EQH57_0201 [Dictyocoela roeselum]|nr:hypothetical protein EQH57_0201 [Dictyocoela roeselum]
MSKLNSKKIKLNLKSAKVVKIKIEEINHVFSLLLPVFPPVITINTATKPCPMHEGFRTRNRRVTINHHFPKSLLISYISFGNPFGSHDILSSRSAQQRIKDEIENEERRINKVAQVNPDLETALFEYKNELSGLKIIHKLNLLRSVDEQDLVNWKVCFEEVARICKWSDEIQQDVLTQIIDINIQYQIGSTFSPQETLHKVLKLKYNENTAYKYQQKLTSIRQQDYYTIRAYLAEITNTCLKLSFCLNWNETITQSKIEEVFYCGLHEKVQFEITKYDQRTLNSVFEKLKHMEHFIIQKWFKEYRGEEQVHDRSLKPGSSTYTKKENHYQWHS